MTKKALNGKIGVTTENIFPVIKKFLYSDHEIFLRELVANAVDASQKMKALAVSGEYKKDLEDLDVRIELDESAKTIKIIDKGIGMTLEEVEKYINQIAFSSAGEFLDKYKDQISNIIGHFGLGFYSAFMVSKEVTIETLSWKDDAKPVLWRCDGSPEYSIEESDKSDRGTVITLYLDDESVEFATKSKIESLLNKYCKFMPIPIVFGKEPAKEGEAEKDHIINNIEPLWTKNPSDLKDEEYLKFYRSLYPLKEDPLFYIHLNVDYPFNLTGILYFPKIKERMAIEKNNIQLYCNQMFVTDHVDNIVPEFLTLLYGVIDSPDIPLNVSRSYLQSDANVKKISTYITKKVSDRLDEIFKDQRELYNEKWNNLKLFIEYGMLTNEKFCERGLNFALLQNTDGELFSFDEYKKKVEASQKDKNDKLIYIYATNVDAQYSFIEAAKSKGYDILLLDCELDSHYIQLLEQKLKDVNFVRVDSASVDRLIEKDDKSKPELEANVIDDLSTMFKTVMPSKYDYIVEVDSLGENSAPMILTQNEFMRRYREMSSMGGGMNFYGSFPQSYNLVLNMDNSLVKSLIDNYKNAVKPMEVLPEMPKDDAPQTQKDKVEEERNEILTKHNDELKHFVNDNVIISQIADLALLSNGLLKGKELNAFVNRCYSLLNNK